MSINLSEKLAELSVLISQTITIKLQIKKFVFITILAKDDIK